MKKITLGNTGIEATELCFGALPFGPLQKNLDVNLCAEILSYGLDMGINFVDTAQLYKTYEPIKIALANRKERPIIATKSVAKSYEDMEFAINEALNSMEIDYIDIFHLHSARNGKEVFDEKKGALECLLDYKKKGIIKAIGISTHNVKLVEEVATRDEIDIIFPLINKIGRGVLNGSVEEMQKAISLCEKNGKGVYLMKALGGGTLIDDYKDSMEFARNLNNNYSIAVGMISKEEVLYNVKYFSGDEALEGIIGIRNKKQIRVLQHQCVSCGHCIEACHSEAIGYVENGKSFIDQSKCIQCGYCVASCPSFAIRIF